MYNIPFNNPTITHFDSFYTIIEYMLVEGIIQTMPLHKECKDLLDNINKQETINSQYSNIFHFHEEAIGIELEALKAIVDLGFIKNLIKDLIIDIDHYPSTDYSIITFISRYCISLSNNIIIKELINWFSYTIYSLPDNLQDIIYDYHKAIDQSTQIYLFILNTPITHFSILNTEVPISYLINSGYMLKNSNKISDDCSLENINIYYSLLTIKIKHDNESPMTLINYINYYLDIETICYYLESIKRIYNKNIVKIIMTYLEYNKELITCINQTLLNPIYNKTTQLSQDNQNTIKQILNITKNKIETESENNILQNIITRYNIKINDIEERSTQQKIIQEKITIAQRIYKLLNNYKALSKKNILEQKNLILFALKDIINNLCHFNIIHTSFIVSLIIDIQNNDIEHFKYYILNYLYNPEYFIYEAFYYYKDLVQEIYAFQVNNMLTKFYNDIEYNTMNKQMILSRLICIYKYIKTIFQIQPNDALFELIQDINETDHNIEHIIFDKRYKINNTIYKIKESIYDQIIHNVYIDNSNNNQVNNSSTKDNFQIFYINKLLENYAKLSMPNKELNKNSILMSLKAMIQNTSVFYPIYLNKIIIFIHLITYTPYNFNIETLDNLEYRYEYEEIIHYKNIQLILYFLQDKKQILHKSIVKTIMSYINHKATYEDDYTKDHETQDKLIDLYL